MNNTLPFKGKSAWTLPSIKESLVCLAAIAIWLTVTALCVGLRIDHFLLAALVLALFYITPGTRRTVIALMPFVVFGISYDWMNIVPNYEVNPVDTLGLYSAEKSLFGINCADGVLRTPNEFFALHTNSIADFFAGVFYLCWVPVPIFFGLWLFFKGEKQAYLHFALVFLLVNLIGFGLYYVHPAAPPWYVANHGFDVVVGTRGEVAGLGAFDSMTGWNVFHGLYARNANVFAAFPSLHSAYTLVALIYAIRSHRHPAWIAALAVITLGIWSTAVYTSHHYIIDVAGGIACALAGFALFEFVLMRIGSFRRFLSCYATYITSPSK